MEQTHRFTLVLSLSTIRGASRSLVLKARDFTFAVCTNDPSFKVSAARILNLPDGQEGKWKEFLGSTEYPYSVVVSLSPEQFAGEVTYCSILRRVFLSALDRKGPDRNEIANRRLITE